LVHTFNATYFFSLNTVLDPHFFGRKPGTPCHLRTGRVVNPQFGSFLYNLLIIYRHLPALRLVPSWPASQNIFSPGQHLSMRLCHDENQKHKTTHDEPQNRKGMRKNKPSTKFWESWPPRTSLIPATGIQAYQSKRLPRSGKAIRDTQKRGEKSSRVERRREHD
jgi:hypothetical protein